MRLAHILLITALLLPACSTSAPARGEEDGELLVATPSTTSSPTDAIQLPSDTPRPSTTPFPGGIEGERFSLGSECAQSIPALRAYQASFELPEELNQRETINLPIQDGIDLNRYFVYLDQLGVQQGYSLSYVYFSDMVGGRPLVYARPNSQPAYTSYEAYSQALGGSSSDQFSFSPLENAFDYLAYIEIADNPEGFLQFAALSLMGDQFYLFWHGLYHDEVILCGQDDIEVIRTVIEDFGLDAPEDVLQAAQNLDLEPYVIMGDEAVFVRFVYFTKWGGVAEAFVTISRAFPHEILEIEGNLLVEYDCGIMF
jgi:hypothetical protein